jgi:hypothetical protein
MPVGSGLPRPRLTQPRPYQVLRPCVIAFPLPPQQRPQLVPNPAIGVLPEPQDINPLMGHERSIGVLGMIRAVQADPNVLAVVPVDDIYTRLKQLESSVVFGTEKPYDDDTPEGQFLNQQNEMDIADDLRAHGFHVPAEADWEVNVSNSAQEHANGLAPDRLGRNYADVCCDWMDCQRVSEYSEGQRPTPRTELTNKIMRGTQPTTSAFPKSA